MFRGLTTTLSDCSWQTQAKDLRLPEKKVQALHVDTIETAPWNYESFVQPNFPRYRRAGGILVGEVVRLSVEMGLQGRVGLYSLEGSERFYRSLGMTRLFEDRDPRSSTRGCWYYELSVKAAQSLIDRQTTGE